MCECPPISSPYEEISNEITKFKRFVDFLIQNGFLSSHFLKYNCIRFTRYIYIKHWVHFGPNVFSSMFVITFDSLSHKHYSKGDL